jgi:hypothetical protein
VVDKLSEAGLKIHPEKSACFQSEILFVGHIINSEGIRPDGSKVKVIQEWKPLTTVTEVRAYLGLTGYYRRWIKNYAAKAKALFDLTKKDQPFIWGPEQQEAFDELKKSLLSAPILALPTKEGKFTLDCDASGFSCACILSQEIDKKLRVIGYSSRAFRKSELNYPANSKEMTAVIYGLRQYRHYLLGKPFILRTDHSALQYMRKSKTLTALQARHLDELAEYNQMEIVHRPGVNHGNADGLSRKINEPEMEIDEDVEQLRRVETRQQQAASERKDYSMPVTDFLADLNRKVNLIGKDFNKVMEQAEYLWWNFSSAND